MLPTLASTTAPPSQESATYRQLFDDGVTALGAEENERAAEFFEAAGRRAPDALIWRAYLRRAKEEAGSAPAWPEATPAPSMERLVWDPVEVAASSNRLVQLSATGERLLYGYQEAALVDVSTGSLVARLRSRIDTSTNHDPPADGCKWTFDTSGRVAIAAGGRWGHGMGLDVRDSLTGRPIVVEGAATLDLTPGARYEWFPLGEEPPECDFEATVDLTSTEGLLRCHLVPRADGSGRAGDLGKNVVLSSNASLAMTRDQTMPTTLWVVDRVNEQIVLERSPAGWASWFSPDGSSLYVRSNEDVRKVGLPSGEELWQASMPPVVRPLGQGAFTFRGDELIEIAATGVVSRFDDTTGVRNEIQRLDPAPEGQVFGAKFVRGETLLIVLDFETTSCYDMDTGKRRWARGVARWFADPATGTVDEAEQRCMIQVEQYRPGVVALDTGETLGVQGSRMVPTHDVVLVEGEQAAIVALAGGELRRVDLATGATTARASSSGEERVYFLRPMANGQLWAAAVGGALLVRDPETLEPTRGVLLGEGASFEAFSQGASPEAFSEDGEYVVTTSRDPARTRLMKLTEDLQGEVVFEEKKYWSAAAFSPSGNSLALAGGGRLKIVDGRTGVLRLERELLEGVQLNVAAFHREEELIVGMAGQDFDPYCGWVVDAGDGHVIAKLGINDPFGGATIMHIHSNPAAGIVILTASQSGTVTAFEDAEWNRKWNHDTSGGNWDTLVVRHAEGSKLACVSGMSATHSRVFDLSTGRTVRHEETLGLMDMALTSSGRFLVGLKDQRLVVKDGASFETLYHREEASGSDAWILRDGTRRPAPGGAPSPVDSTHLIQDGWSAPISSFDAWLHDPLELVSTSLSKLPGLPVILDAKELQGTDGARELAITVGSTATLVGAVFQDAAGDETFVPIPEDDRQIDPAKPLLLDAPTMAWASVRLVTSSGVLTRPVRRR
ncbi:MAG: hypothetical protein ACJA2W_000808 [Planctomycetota bacterium]|jgi:hypothetical protein